MREISEDELRKLKSATHYGLKLAGGPDSVENVTRVRQGQLSKYASNGPEHVESFMPIDIAVECDRLAGQPIIIGRAAALLGYRLVRDAGEAASGGLTDRDVNALSAELGDFMRAYHTASEDNHLDSSERRQLRLELGELIRKATEINEKLEG